MIINNQFITTEWEKDKSSPSLDMSVELYRVEELHRKYLRFLYNHINPELITKKEELLSTTRKKRDYYLGIGDTVCKAKYSKTIVNSLLETDDDLVRLSSELKTLMDLKDYVTDIVDYLKYRPNYIKTQLEIQKYYQGM